MESGKLKLSQPQRARMDAALAKLKDGRPVEVIINPLPRRSHNQNAYYWSAVIPEIQAALHDLGHEVDAQMTHEMLKAKFNSRPFCNANGEVIGDMPESTTLMNVAGFMDYLDRIIKWAAEFLGVCIPPPNSQTILFNTTY